MERRLREKISELLPIQVLELEDIEEYIIKDIDFLVRKVYFNKMFIPGLYAAFRIVDMLDVKDFVVEINPDSYNIGRLFYGPNFARYFELKLYKK